MYIGVLLLSALCLFATSTHGRRHPELLASGPEVDRWVNEPVTAVTAAILGVALVLDDAIEWLWLRIRGRSG